MRKASLFIILSLFTCLSFAQERNIRLVKPPTENPTTQTRKAIVIGMSDYGKGKAINNTLNDANDMADALARLGFEVTLLKNNDLRNLSTHLNNWYSTIEGNDMAVFYFAGHGMEVNGINYLITIDAELNSQTDVEYNTLNVNQILGNMDEKRVGMKLIILDACRDNPFKRSWSRGSEDKGLAQMTAPKDIYIAFAASPGFTVQDGANYNLKNGVFTHFLKDEILKTGISIDEIFNNVISAVSNLTHEQQTPFKNSSLTKNFYFIPPGAVSESSLVLLEKANNFFENKQYNEAFPLYERVAKEGDAFGQNMLGKCYYHGNGVIKDYAQAVGWWKKAAEQGEANAQTNLGVCYYNGQGVAKNYYQAVYWYKKAANQGEVNAQINLGVCYYNGRGIVRDYNQAAEWYKKAANQGKLTAQYNLGTCYEDGYGVAQDYNQAVYWYKKAADQGDEDAKKALKRLNKVIN